MPLSELAIEPYDRTRPSGRWAFDSSVAACFDNMLARSIPQHEAMRHASFELGRQYVQPGTAIVDLGCSRGAALAPYVEAFGSDNQYVGVEVSAPMLSACRERFSCEIERGIVDIREADLRDGYPDARASLTLSILTAQFIPIEHRQRVLRSVYASTVPGGALLIVEKVLGATADLNEQMVARYYDLKRSNGYSQDEIDRKRLSLEGVLVPVTARWNEELLLAAGFAQVDCFWRWMNFAGWIAVKASGRDVSTGVY